MAALDTCHARSGRVIIAAGDAAENRQVRNINCGSGQWWCLVEAEVLQTEAVTTLLVYVGLRIKRIPLPFLIVELLTSPRKSALAIAERFFHLFLHKKN